MAIEIKKDGRTIRTKKDYSKFRRELYYSQHGRCIRCERPTMFNIDIDSDYAFHVAHRGSRGMGSSFRDDVLGPNKGQVLGGLCGRCHRKEHHQQ